MQKMNRKINVQRGSLSAADLAFWAAAQSRNMPKRCKCSKQVMDRKRH